MTTFGEYIKELRIRAGISLREFCLKNEFDAGNHSKLERGTLAPPQDVGKLKELAFALGVHEGTDSWHQMVDLASAETGRLPQDIRDDSDLVRMLPVVFRTIRNRHLNREDLERLIEKLKKA